MTTPDDAERLAKFDEMTARAYRDTRLTPGARELILAMAWVMTRDPEYPRDGSVFPRVKKLLGPPTQRWRENGRRSRMSELIEADAPRYEPPAGVECHGSAAFCEAPRMRAYRARTAKPGSDQPTLLRPHPPTHVTKLPGWTPPPAPSKTDPCGANGHTLVIEKDPLTGWSVPHWFCRRHLGEARRIEAQLAEPNEIAPEPIPNRGGMLASYINTDFEKLYRYHARGWEPPVYGVCAEDWPTPGVESGIRRPRLRLLLAIGGDA